MRHTTVLIVTSIAALLGAPARAQDQAFVGGAAGASFNAATAPLVQIQAGVTIVPAVQIVGELAYMRDVLPSIVRERIDTHAHALEQFTQIVLGQTINVDGSATARMLTGAAGVRLIALPGKIRPFVQVDMGFAQIKPRIQSFASNQAISGAFPLPPAINATETKPAIGFGIGVDVALGGHVAAEARYKFTRVFADQVFEPFAGQAFNVNAATLGIAYRF